MIVKITSVEHVSMWVRSKAILGVVIPGIMAPAAASKCQVIVAGAVLEVTREEAEDIRLHMEQSELADEAKNNS